LKTKKKRKRKEERKRKKILKREFFSVLSLQDEATPCYHFISLLTGCLIDPLCKPVLSAYESGAVLRPGDTK
jgi:hypothetical protein